MLKSIARLLLSAAQYERERERADAAEKRVAELQTELDAMRGNIMDHSENESLLQQALSMAKSQVNVVADANRGLANRIVRLEEAVTACLAAARESPDEVVRAKITLAVSTVLPHLTKPAQAPPPATSGAVMDTPAPPPSPATNELTHVIDALRNEAERLAESRDGQAA